MNLSDLFSSALKLISSIDVEFPIGKTPRIRFRPKTPRLSLNGIDKKIKALLKKENPLRNDLILALKDLKYKNPEDVADRTLTDFPEEKDLANLVTAAIRSQRKPL